MTAILFLFMLVFFWKIGRSGLEFAPKLAAQLCLLVAFFFLKFAVTGS